jgi:hypothetical protein|tara:strand:- start:388 stop:597 length:210 start_codon:yes stop_codon:yes gene_type:complete
LVEVELTESDYLQLEKWFGLLFGGRSKEVKSNIEPDGSDKILFQKLSVMHLALMEEQMEEIESMRDDDK